MMKSTSSLKIPIIFPEIPGSLEKRKRTHDIRLDERLTHDGTIHMTLRREVDNRVDNTSQKYPRPQESVISPCSKIPGTTELRIHIRKTRRVPRVRERVQIDTTRKLRRLLQKHMNKFTPINAPPVTRTFL